MQSAGNFDRAMDNMGRSMNKQFVILAMGGLVILSGCGKRNAEVEAANDQGVPVRIMRVEMRQLADVSSLPGVLEPVSELWIAAEQGGRIVEMNVDEGDRVAAADTLFSVDARVLKMGLRQARIDAENAARDAERHKRLAEDGALAERDYDQVIFRRDMTDAALRLSEVMVARCSVLAPQNGVVDQRLVDAGEYVNEGQAVLRLVNADRLHAVIDVPERDIIHIKQAMPVGITVVAAGSFHTGKVDFVAMTADRSTHTFRVKVAVDNDAGTLRGGMLIDACVNRGVRDVITVPLTAVVPRRGEHVVFLAENGHAVMRRVQIVDFSGEDAIVAGLEAGERVIIDGHRGMRDGVPVRVDEDVPGAAGHGVVTCGDHRTEKEPAQ